VCVGLEVLKKNKVRNPVSKKRKTYFHRIDFIRIINHFSYSFLGFDLSLSLWFTDEDEPESEEDEPELLEDEEEELEDEELNIITNTCVSCYVSSCCRDCGF
jgi:hypothetical protein